MTNDSIEFDIVVNGKPAVSSIKDVEKAQSDLEQNSSKVATTIKANWVAIGAAAAAVVTSVGLVMNKALEAEKAMFGLTNQTKQWIRSASEQYGMSQNIIAGFVQTGKAAGMAGEEIASMIDTAVALGRAYPHESTESFIDNLTMLNRTGEAQGYIVDILEQKFGLIDLKLISTADKMAAVEEATKGVNKEFDKTNAADAAKSFVSVDNALTSLGTSASELAGEAGVFTAISSAINWISEAASNATMALKGLKTEITNAGGGGGGSWGDEGSKIDIKGKAKAKEILPTFSKTAQQQQIKDAMVYAEQQAKIQEQFTDKYNRATKSRTDYTIDNLAKERDAHIAAGMDKIKADEIYYAESAKVLEANKPKSLGGGGGVSKSNATGDFNRDLEREREDAARINQEFWEEYARAGMTAGEYELAQLQDQYEEYKKYVTDKKALDEWYAQEQKRIMDENSFQMQAYADMAQTLTDDMADALIQFAQTGKMSFSDMARSIINDLAAIQIRASMNSILGGVMNMAGGAFSGMGGGGFEGAFANGAAFNKGKVTAFASGGVVGAPTMFPMAGGTGLMGEDGPEAIVPLTRTSGGDLGVKATAPVVNVNVQNYGNDKVQVQQSGDNINVVISQIASQIQRGTGDIGSAIESRYGLRKA